MRLCSTTCPFPEEDKIIFSNVQKVLSQLKEVDFSQRFDPDITATPYILARAFSEALRLECVHGIFEDYDSVSWLKTPNGNIIDIMPVGVFGDNPLLIHGKSTRARSYRAKTKFANSANVETCIHRIKKTIIEKNNHH